MQRQQSAVRSRAMKHISEYQDKIKDLEAEVEKWKKRSRGLQDQYRAAQYLSDETTSELEALRSGGFKKGPHGFEGLTLIIAYYNIPKHIERTLMSCAPAYQNAPKDKIEVIIADNGSTEPLPDDLQERFPFVSKILRTEGKPSPVFALNDAIENARFDMIGIMIDGAHMLSPGIFRNTRDISQLYARPVINVPQYYLGNVSQNLNPKMDAWKRETWWLDRINWPEKGYALFNYALFPGENVTKSRRDSIESNCLIARREVFEDCGAFDPRFDEPGAGFANLEMFTRLTNHKDNTYVMFPGEGTFHQDHDGTTTRKSPEERDIMVANYRAKYEEISGISTLPNIKSPMMYGVQRRSCDIIPTISKQYGQVKNKILTQLSNIYVHRARNGIDNNFHPKLVRGDLVDEREARPPLHPRGIGQSVAEKYRIDEGDLRYLNFLRRLHEVREPELYFEIGVDQGYSMAQAKCPAVGVDPAFSISTPIPQRVKLFKEKSDDFFNNKKRAQRLFKNGIDLAFIDGMHLAEFVVRDFINVEKYCKPGSVIMFDDVLPEQMEMADRPRRFNAWTGDVYKIAPILRKYRPDLEVGVFHTFIGPYRKGLAVVKNPDPNNTALEDNYEEIERDIFGDGYKIESIEHLDEMMQIAPHGEFEKFIAV